MTHGEALSVMQLFDCVNMISSFKGKQSQLAHHLLSFLMLTVRLSRLSRLSRHAAFY